MSQPSFNPDYEYSQVESYPEDSINGTFENKDRSRKFAPTYRLLVLAVVLVLTAGGTGFWLGRQGWEERTSFPLEYMNALDDSHPGGLVSRTFDYNGTFTLAPSNESDGAWDSLFPSMGNIKDPAGVHEVVGISIFHQLHCLDLLRHVFYAAELGIPPTGSSHQPVGDPVAHAKHCFDYLRQALMCAADATLEPQDELTGVITGLEVVHVCRDYEALIAWTEERKLET